MNNLDYFGKSRREMIPFVPPTATRILDVGCGGGSFAAGLKKLWAEQGRPLEIWGLELDTVAAERAAEVMDHIQQGDAAELVTNLPKAYFDAVVLNDVLEHMVEPGDFLRSLLPLLAAEGRIVVSLPNVRYFFNVKNLAAHGRWEYTDEGICDRTHLRFFTRSSIVTLLENAGYRPLLMTGINPTGSWRFHLLNFATLGRWSDMRYLQFATVAVPRDAD